MARNNAERSVTASPQLIEKSLEPANETKPIPATHRIAATILNIVGRLCIAIHEIKGTMTQYRPVRNDDFAAVVSVSPSEFAIYPAIIATPSNDDTKTWSANLRSRINRMI